MDPPGLKIKLENLNTSILLGECPSGGRAAPSWWRSTASGWSWRATTTSWTWSPTWNFQRISRSRKATSSSAPMTQPESEPRPACQCNETHCGGLTSNVLAVPDYWIRGVVVMCRGVSPVQPHWLRKFKGGGPEKEQKDWVFRRKTISWWFTC